MQKEEIFHGSHDGTPLFHCSYFSNPNLVLGGDFKYVFWFSPYLGKCSNLTNYHQEFQVPKMEVLNLIRPFWGWVFPYISLTYSFRYLKCLVKLVWFGWNHQLVLRRFVARQRQWFGVSSSTTQQLCHQTFATNFSCLGYQGDKMHDKIADWWPTGTGSG